MPRVQTIAHRWPRTPYSLPGVFRVIPGGECVRLLQRWAGPGREVRVVNTAAERTGTVLRIVAVVLMLADAAMLVARRTPGTAIPVITVGIALAVIIENRKRTQG